jgi:hypothetical protein
VSSLLRTLIATVTLGAAATLAGCSPSAVERAPVTSATVQSSQSPQSSPTESPSPSTSSSGTSSSTSPTSSVSGQLSLTEADNRHMVDVSAGQLLVATLHNTYWRFAPPGAGLTQVGEEVVTPAPRGTCLPGIGCGTVVARYRAIAPGQAHLRANRTSCGEALPCAPGQGSWTVLVRIR